MKYPKEKHIHKNKHYPRQTHMGNRLIIVEVLYGTWGEGK
jgi:hypothetical protein